MKQETLKQIKQELFKVSELYQKLVTNWNGDLKHGNDATYPITIIVEVLLHNMAHDGSDCVGYNASKEEVELYSNLEMIKELNEYTDKCYMIHFAFTEARNIINGLTMLEDEEILRKNEHITDTILYIQKYNTSLPYKDNPYDIVEIPIGTKLKFIKYGDESNTYSSDPVHANCYSFQTDQFSVNCKWLYTDPSMSLISFYRGK